MPKGLITGISNNIRGDPETLIMIRKIVSLMSFAAMSSCLAPSRKTMDLTLVSTNDPDLKRGYQTGYVYITRRDLLIKNNRSSFSLVKEGGSEPFINQFRSDPKSYPSMLGVLPAGARIKVTHIVYYEGSGVGNMVITYGEIGEGPFRGKEVLLQGVSDFIYGTKYGTINIPDVSIMIVEM